MSSMEATATEEHTEAATTLLNKIHERFGWTAPVRKEKAKRPETVNGVQVRMPEGYDFSTRGKNWSEYTSDFRLRTDAVWEKQQLKDWYRLYYKCFYFNKGLMKYEFIEPEDMYTIFLEPWQFDDDEVETWRGFSKTGRTTAFQTGLGPKQRIANTFNTFYSMPDYYMMCAMRFEKWWRCDMIYYDERKTKYDENPVMAKAKSYPCYREYYEATYTCADDIFDYLIELAYAKRASDFFEGDVSNNEIRSFPTVYDTPKGPERVTYTY